MTAVKTSISINEWIMKKMIGNTKNRSGRIEELIIKGYMSELEEIKSAIFGISSQSHFMDFFENKIVPIGT